MAEIVPTKQLLLKLKTPNEQIAPKIGLKQGLKLKSGGELSGNPVTQTQTESQLLEKKYQKMKHKEHILHTPNMYVGSVESTTDDMYVFDEESQQIVKKRIKYVPGLYKVFDEGMVNMRDHYMRMKDIIDRQKLMNDGKLPHDPQIDLNRKYRPVKSMDISIDKATGEITFRNDGDGIDVAFHNEEKLWIPQLIMGELLSGTNFDKTQEKTWGGKHGYGAKLMNLLGLKFLFTTVDEHRKLKYVQLYENNMVAQEPVITAYKGVPYTEIQFIPDFKRFGLTSLNDDDTVLLMHKRAYDLAGVTSKEVSVTYNGKKIDVRTFERYVDLYIGTRGQCKRIHSEVNKDWEIVVCASDDGFEQVSFVNGVCTSKGGKHVDHAATIVSARLAKFAVENKKGMSHITPKNVKDNMWIFINCTMVNPNFDTQTKDNFTTNIGDFRSRCDVSEDFITKLAQPKLGILENASKLATFKADKNLKKTDGKKKRHIKNEKIVDAHWAGDPKKSQDCTLILTEGDSASGLAVAGLAALSEAQRKYYGILPLGGKIVNPKDSKVSVIEKNGRYLDIKESMGLRQGFDYSTSINTLRYGRIMIMTDADHDGDHIKGLLINLFHEYWLSLLKRKGFFRSLLTPIVKATIGSQEIEFYSQKDYHDWKNGLTGDQLKQYEIKYYKGLGTHEAEEARALFLKMRVQEYSWDDISNNLQESIVVKDEVKTEDVEFDDIKNDIKSVNGDPIGDNGTESIASEKTDLLYAKYCTTPNKHPCDLAIQLAFMKKLADCRKGWIRKYLIDQSQGYVNDELHNIAVMSYNVFINKKFIDFSVYDNIRNIPHIMDGLKPGQRKVIFAAKKRRLRKEVKVAQFCGYIAEQTGYHHGEASLNETVVTLGQDYPGSNNVNLLVPKGMFGTRFKNGGDHASTRYIFTYMNPVTEIIFNKNDEPLFEYCNEEGKSLEPQFYVPILPMILVNGARGIGTGWSTDIPSYNPKDIIENIKLYLDGQPLVEMIPWYRGFRGLVTKISNQKYRVTGVYSRTGPKTIEINEIPIGSARESKSFFDYQKFIEGLIIDDEAKDEDKAKQILTDADILVSDTNINCVLHFESSEKLDSLLADINVFEKTLKLSHSISTTNMHLFNIHGIMSKYESPEAILTEYCQDRVQFYVSRKRHLMDQIESDILQKNEKIRFITYINDDTHPLKVQKRKKADITAKLEEYKFAKFPKNGKKVLSKKEDDDIAEDDDNDDVDDNKEKDDKNMTYDYLSKMSIYSLTVEMIEKLHKERDQLLIGLENLRVTTTTQLWTSDLSDFTSQMQLFDNDWNKRYKALLNLPRSYAPLKNKFILKPKAGTQLALKPKISLVPKISLKKLTDIPIITHDIIEKAEVMDIGAQDATEKEIDGIGQDGIGQDTTEKEIDGIGQDVIEIEQDTTEKEQDGIEQPVANRIILKKKTV
jgi:DNA topoisomerase-2